MTCHRDLRKSLETECLCRFKDPFNYWCTLSFENDNESRVDVCANIYNCVKVLFIATQVYEHLHQYFVLALICPMKGCMMEDTFYILVRVSFSSSFDDVWKPNLVVWFFIYTNKDVIFLLFPWWSCLSKEALSFVTYLIHNVSYYLIGLNQVILLFPTE